MNVVGTMQYESLSDILDKIRQSDFKTIDFLYKKILAAKKNNYQKLTLTRSTIEGSPATFKLIIEKDGWVRILEQALKTLEKQEDYEGCSKIKKLMDDL